MKSGFDDQLTVYSERLQFVEETIRKILLEIFEQRVGMDVVKEQALGSANVEEMDFYCLDKADCYGAEIAEIRRRISRLAQKLASKKSRRYRRAKKGRVDLRRTIGASVSTGGVPVCLKYRRRATGKPELVLLCDVSRSVALFSEFMLQLVYAIQHHFRAVRSFFFIDAVDEVTEYFRNNDFRDAIRESLEHANFAFRGFSDYGRVFSMFANIYLQEISRRSTLVILGDARNNGYPDDRRYLEIISNHVRRVLWLNPQPGEEWNREDSIMDIYAGYCTGVYECRNLVQLESVVDEVLCG